METGTRFRRTCRFDNVTKMWREKEMEANLRGQRVDDLIARDVPRVTIAYCLGTKVLEFSASLDDFSSCRRSNHNMASLVSAFLGGALSGSFLGKQLTKPRDKSKQKTINTMDLIFKTFMGILAFCVFLMVLLSIASSLSSKQ